jgi:uncharacterized protein (DUF885 family)
VFFCAQAHPIHDGEGGREQQALFSETERYMAIPGQALLPIKQGIENIGIERQIHQSLGTKFEIKVS